MCFDLVLNLQVSVRMNPFFSLMQVDSNSSHQNQITFWSIPSKLTTLLLLILIEFMSKPEQQFSQFIQKIESTQIHRTVIPPALKKYELHYSDLTKLNPESITKMRKMLLSKQYEQQNKKDSQNQEWVECQRKLYVWLLLCYLALNDKTIRELSDDDYSFLSLITTHKNIPILKFMAFGLVKTDKRPLWSLEEDDILFKVVAIQKKFKTVGEWSLISKQLFLRGKMECLKTSKNCRERWFNHLDPSLKKDWSVDEDIRLMTFVKEHGKKWAKIVIQLQNTKNQHMVKNRYNSLLKKAEKRLGDKTKEKNLINQVMANIQEIDHEQNVKKTKKNFRKNQKLNNQCIKKQQSIAFLQPTLRQIKQAKQAKEQDQQGGIKMIISKNYSSTDGDIQKQLSFDDGNIKYLLQKNLIKQEPDDESPVIVPRAPSNTQFQFNKSINLGHPSPIAPTPLPIFFTSPLPSEDGRFATGSFYNFSKFMGNQ